jgi:hypothetical protein
MRPGERAEFLCSRTDQERQLDMGVQVTVCCGFQQRFVGTVVIKAAPAAPRPALPAPGSALGGPPSAPAPSHH